VKLTRLLLLLFSSALASADSVSLTRESLEGPMFQSIGIKPGQPPQLQLRFKGSGARFLLFRDGKEDKVSDYNETVTVKIGEAFTLTEQHGSLEFAPLPKPLDQHGWLLSLNFDARSFGGKETSRYAIVLILNGREVRFVQPDPNFDPKLPPTDPTYQRIEKLVAGASPPSMTSSLFADTPGGRVGPPFPASATKLLLAWKLPSGSATDPLGVRWIAADTGGVAPKDHVISSSKSEPGKTEGIFTLSKPTAGFPPGKYRIEILQAGKIVYTENFEIRKEK
jgi:hypothetical protein